MKVLQIAKYMPPCEDETAKAALAVLRALPEGTEQKIICFNADAVAGEQFYSREETARERVEGVETVRCGYSAKIASQAISPAFKGELKVLMEEFSPDIVLFHYPNPLVAKLLLKYAGKPFSLYLYWHRDIVRQKLWGRLFRRQTEKLLARAEKIFVTCPNYVYESAHLAPYAEKCALLPYCIDGEKVTVTREDKLLAQEIRNEYAGKTLVCSLDRAEKYKGLEALIDAVKALPGNTVLLLNGEGEYADRLRERAVGVKKIKFLSKLSNAQWRAYLLAGDVYAYPAHSPFESFSLSLAEAMAVGIPAVTCRVPRSAISYINEDGVTGITCEEGSVSALKEAIATLTREEVLRTKYAGNARARMEKLFSFGQFSAQVKRHFTLPKQEEKEETK